MHVIFYLVLAVAGTVLLIERNWAERRGAAALRITASNWPTWVPVDSPRFWAVFLMVTGTTGLALTRLPLDGLDVALSALALGYLAGVSSNIMFAKNAAFQWYVAWRYLMERPRRLSGSILAVTGFLTWAELATGATGLLHPFTDSIYFGGRSVPEWVTAATGCAVAMIPTAIVAEVVRILIFARPRPHPIVRIGAGVLFGACAVSIGVFALAFKFGMPRVLIWSFWIGTGALTLAVLATLFATPRQVSPTSIVFLAWAGIATIALLGVGYWFRREPGLFPHWFVVCALIAIGQLPITLGILVKRRESTWESDRTSSSRALLILRHAVRLFAIALNVFTGGTLVALAGFGAVHVVIPRIDMMPSLLVNGALAAAGVGILVAVVAVARRNRNVALLGVRLIALAVAIVAFVVFVLVGGEAYAGVMRFGGSMNLPMWLVIAGGISGALAFMSLILAGIRYFFTFFTSVSIGGVALGVTALVIVLSVMSGFETDLRKKILGSNAHILISKEDSAGGNFAEYPAVMERLTKVEGVVAQTPYLLSEVVIAANSNYANVIIKGIDPRTVGDVTDLDENVEEKHALERLWPLADDGGVLGPVDAGVPVADGPDAAAPEPDALDPAPDDFDVPGGEPIDLSGGETEIALPVVDAGEVIDPAPDDMVVVDEEPVDLSGGQIADEPGDDLDVEAPPIDAGPDDEVDVEIAPILEGIEDPFERGDTLEPHLPPRIARLSGVLVGRELVKQINLYDGQEVKVISPLGENTPAGPVPRTKLFRIAGTFFTGMYEYDLKFIYVELTALQDFLDIGDEVRGIEIRVRDPERTGEVMDRMLAQFPPFGAAVGSPTGPFAEAIELIRKGIGPHYRIQDWKELNRSLFSALKLEKITMFLVLAIIIVVAAFSIVGNLIMVVIEKAKEIAVLKTLGASDGGIMWLFVVQGFFIGLVGTLIGLVLGLGACWLNIRYGIPINPEVYYIDRLPMHVESSSIILVAAAGIVISVIATIYPAFTGARIEPVKGLRYE